MYQYFILVMSQRSVEISIYKTLRNTVTDSHGAWCLHPVLQLPLSFSTGQGEAALSVSLNTVMSENIMKCSSED